MLVIFKIVLSSFHLFLCIHLQLVFLPIFNEMISQFLYCLCDYALKEGINCLSYLLQIFFQSFIVLVENFFHQEIKFWGRGCWAISASVWCLILSLLKGHSWQPSRDPVWYQGFQLGSATRRQAPYLPYNLSGAQEIQYLYAIR